MLEIILGLLLALGINLGDETAITVIDQQTGISYGVGTTAGGTQGSNGEPITNETYMLVQDDNGEYHLIRR